MTEALDLIPESILTVINTTFLFDMISNFFSGYYENGLVVEDKIAIAKRYITGTFIYDVIGNFVF